MRVYGASDDLIDFEGVACAGDLRAADTLKDSGSEVG